MNQLESQLEEYLVKKAPALPPNIKEAIVKFAPYLTLILIIMFLPAILAAFGLGTLALPFAYMGGFGFSYTLAMAVMAVTIGIEVIALPGLFKRQLSAWRLLFYSSLISAVSSLLQGNVVNLLIGTLISLYVLFQVKSYYK